MTNTPEDTDALFYERADALIHSANEQLNGMSKNRVSASFLFAAARFQAWLVGSTFKNRHEWQTAAPQALDFFG